MSDESKKSGRQDRRNLKRVTLRDVAKKAVAPLLNLNVTLTMSPVGSGKTRCAVCAHKESTGPNIEINRSVK